MIENQFWFLALRKIANHLVAKEIVTPINEKLLAKGEITILVGGDEKFRKLIIRIEESFLEPDYFHLVLYCQLESVVSPNYQNRVTLNKENLDVALAIVEDFCKFQSPHLQQIRRNLEKLL